MGEVEVGGGGGGGVVHEKRREEGPAVVVGTRSSRKQQHGGGGEGGGGGRGRRRQRQGSKLVVGMKSTSCSREMLAWVIAKLAQPGDHILAVHVAGFAACRTQARAAAEEGEKSTTTHIQQQLGKSLEGVLSVYEDMCNLKRVRLQLESIRGCKAKKSLVEFVRKQGACKLVLGTNKHLNSDRWSTCLGMYCQKRLPSMCTVVIVEHGLIVFEKQGCLGTECPSKSSLSLHNSEEEEKSGHSSELEMIGSSPSSSLETDDSSSSPTSVLPSPAPEQEVTISGTEKFGISSSERQKRVLRESPCSRRLDFHFADPLVGEALVSSQVPLPQGKNSFSPCMKKLPGDESSRKSSPGSETATQSSDLTPGWPLMHNGISFSRKPTLYPVIKQSLSVVNWAFQLPGISRFDGSLTFPRGSVEAQCNKLLAELSSKAFKTSMRSPVNVGISTRTSSQGNISTLAQELECLHLNRPCTRFLFNELKAATSNFSPSNIIGRGGASQVYKGQTKDGKLVAVKCLNQGGHQAEEEILTDIQITCSLSHVNIVKLLGYCTDAPHMILVYDYVAQGSLDDHLHGGDEVPVLPWEIRHKVAVGVAEALNYLQDGCPRPVIHRDVKASNILLTGDFEPQLSDFGLAKWGPTNATHIPCNDVVGTFGYLAPEYFMYGKVNDKTDVYSFGVVLLELITGRTPIDTSRPKGEENLVTWARPLLVDRNLEKLVDPRLGLGMYDPNEMESMVVVAALCVQQSAPRRPSMSQVLKILHGDQSEDLSFLQRQEARLSFDVDDMGCSLSDKGGEVVDMQMHMALAMLGVDDDDATSQCSTDPAHSDAFLEEYLEDRVDN
ncbi:unnamed protein product [Sphagnum troendelagicum]|uniref:Protein kinase domain-containing protein n=1 Tax=Sphagnum troendelagicum TaxID=128251 RepID=A0ABP0T9X1_9BRYO